MGLNVEDLDGTYTVRSETSENGAFVVNGDGKTEIKNGLTYRKDKNGFIWESAFSIIGPDTVQMESTIDPSHADGDKYIKDAQGNPTKSMLTYKSVLNARREDGKLVLYGVIEHGSEKTRLTLIKD